jgi:hypothetical protein
MAWIARASQRRTVRRAVGTVCQVVVEEAFALLGERAIDLSTEGMLLESEHEPTVGADVIVSFRAPGTRIWLDAEATVARIVRGRRRADRARGIGLRFRGMDAVSRAILHATLEGRPPPVPARQVRKDYARSIRTIAGV